MQHANGKSGSTTFNSRLRPIQIALATTQSASEKLKLDYEYNTGTNADNNGNVLKQTITVPDAGQNQGFTAVQTYTYDELNRIKTANETGTDGWTQIFLYDRYGNKNFEEATTTTLTKSCGSSPNFTVCANDRKHENPEIEAINNRIKQLQPDGDRITDYEYDAAGNTTKDPSNRRFKYDGENKQIKVAQLDSNGNETSVIGEYFFDGDGKRVKKLVPSTGETTIFHYDAGGKLIAEYSTVVENVSPQVSYLTSDHLGSPRLITNQFGNVTSRRDFQPYGEEIYSTDRTTGIGYSSDSVRQKFTGYERDNESQLDFAQERMHNFALGRFTTPDDFTQDTHSHDASSWNLYVFVRNNPLRYVDDDGNKATITTSTDRESGVTTVTIKASFAVYAAEGQEISRSDLEKYSNQLVDGIIQAYAGEYESNGRKFVIKTDISAQVLASESDAKKTGADNLVELGTDDLVSTSRDGKSIGGAVFSRPGESFDRMRVGVTPTTIGGFQLDDQSNTFAHEFAHLLGVSDNTIKGSLFNTEGPASRLSGSDFETLFPEEHSERNGIQRPPSLDGRRKAGTQLWQKTGSGIRTSTTPTMISRRSGGLELNKWVKRNK